VTLESRWPRLLGLCDAKISYSRAERVFILEHYLPSKSFAAVREAFSNVYPDKEVPNKTTVHRLVTKFCDTGSVCLWQVLIERQDGWNYGCTDLKQRISCNSGIRLQEFNIAFGFFVLCVKGFMCSSEGCVLNVTSCSTITGKYVLMDMSFTNARHRFYEWWYLPRVFKSTNCNIQRQRTSVRCSLLYLTHVILSK
jgi:hypothetical protein